MERVSDSVSVCWMGAGAPPSSPPAWLPRHHHSSVLRGPRALEVAHGAAICGQRVWGQLLALSSQARQASAGSSTLEVKKQASKAHRLTHV